MIEQLKNCPQCGGILNEAGRCEFCGSKVYDFLSIDFNKREYPSAKTYIRIKNGNMIYLAPIIVSGCDIEMTTPALYMTAINGYRELVKGTPETTIKLDCMVVGDMYAIDAD